jgi:hypothetical protein
MRPAVCLLVAVALYGSASAADKPEDQAKAAAIEFLKALRTKEPDAVLKLTATPFLYHEGSLAMHKDAAALKTWVTAKLQEIKDADKVPATVEEVVAFATLKEKIKDEAERALAEEAVGKDGFVAITSTGDGKKVVIPVRIRDGKARVVGIIVQ